MKSPKINSASPLYAIPGFGPASVWDLNELGIFAVADLIEKDPEKLYAQLEQQRGTHIDRCILYGFREAVYFAEGGRNPRKLKWWNWKDKDGLPRKNHMCGVNPLR